MPSKSGAWDLVGLQFWQFGRDSAKPAPESLAWFCDGLGDGHRCLVIGGTTVDLVRAAARTGADVTVLDFSARVCEELPRYVPAGVTIVHGDALDPPAALSPGTFHRAASDTLLNRLDEAEAWRFAAAIARLLAAGGQVRSTVTAGLYPMDHRLLAAGRESGCLEEFWDEATRTIDYAGAGPEVLERALLPHGDLPRSTLITWYLQRGREKRYVEDDLVRLFDTPHWERVELTPDGARADRVRVNATRT